MMKLAQLICCLLFVCVAAGAQAQAPFYEGKNILLVSGTDAGGRRAANYLYKSVKPDGLNIDLQPHVQLRAPRRADRVAQGHPQLSLNSAALDRRGALAIYLRPEILTGSVYGS